MDVNAGCRIRPKGYMTGRFADLYAAAGVKIPDIARALGLFPMEDRNLAGSCWIRKYDEMMPVRGGGDWSDGLGAGPSAFFAYHGREMKDFKFTFRVSYVP